MSEVNFRSLDQFPEPSFTLLVNRLLHDPDNQAAADRLFGTLERRPLPTQAQQLRIGAFHQEQLIGWTHAYLQHGGVLYASSSGVEPAHRRKGIYAQLLNALEAEAQRWHCVRIESHHRAENVPVIIAKLKAGYRIVGTEFNGQHGVLVKMAKHIDGARDTLFRARSGPVEAALRFFDGLPRN